MEFLSYFFLISLILLFTILTSTGGLGAAFIIIPTLLIFGYPIVLASLMGLIFNFINTSTASFRHYKKHAISFKLSVLIIAMSLIGAPVGALLVNLINAALLKFIFAIVLILIGLNIIRKATKSPNSQNATAEDIDDIKISMLVSLILETQALKF